MRVLYVQTEHCKSLRASAGTSATPNMLRNAFWRTRAAQKTRPNRHEARNSRSRWTRQVSARDYFKHIPASRHTSPVETWKCHFRRKSSGTIRGGTRWLLLHSAVPLHATWTRCNTKGVGWGIDWFHTTDQSSDSTKATRTMKKPQSGWNQTQFVEPNTFLRTCSLHGVTVMLSICYPHKWCQNF